MFRSADMRLLLSLALEKRGCIGAPIHSVVWMHALCPRAPEANRGRVKMWHVSWTIYIGVLVKRCHTGWHVSKLATQYFSSALSLSLSLSILFVKNDKHAHVCSHTTTCICVQSYSFDSGLMFSWSVTWHRSLSKRR